MAETRSRMQSMQLAPLSSSAAKMPSKLHSGLPRRSRGERSRAARPRLLPPLLRAVSQLELLPLGLGAEAGAWAMVLRLTLVEAFNRGLPQARLSSDSWTLSLTRFSNRSLCSRPRFPAPSHGLQLSPLTTLLFVPQSKLQHLTLLQSLSLRRLVWRS